ncbi:MAG: redoxin domain-containing protein [Tepidisphaera sp.]|nr:redoxin domain-containing protein [Tepidisphaera sp.]
MSTLLKAIVVAGFVGTGVVASGQTPTPTRQAAESKDAGAILDAARAAVANVHALSYKAAVSGVGALEGKVPSQTADVSAAKADAGGWKVYTKGSQTGEGGKSQSFEIGYDGVTARAINEADKVIFEKTVQEWPDVPTFFATQSARPVVAWEVLDEKAMDAAGKATKWLGAEKVGGEMCDVVQVGEPADHGVKYYLSQADHLPRRIDRFEALPGQEAGVRRLEIADLKLDDKSVAGTYSIAAPEGYAVRVAKRERVAGGDNERKLGDPDDTKGHLAKRGAVNEGDMAPDFSLKDKDGKNVTLADLKGKVVVMDFWGTWCPWCVKAMPQVQKVHEKYKDKDVVVLGMDVEGNAAAKPLEFMKRNKFTYNTLLDAQPATETYKVSAFPTLFVLDKTGKVIFKEEGFSPDLFEKVSKAIDGVLGPQ